MVGETIRGAVNMMVTMPMAFMPPRLNRAVIQAVDRTNQEFGFPTLTETMNFVNGETAPKDFAAKSINAAIFIMTEGGGNRNVHKNSNSYVGPQGVYEIKVDGQTHKYGKADMTNTSATTGQPTRLQSQLNKLKLQYSASLSAEGPGMA